MKQPKLRRAMVHSTIAHTSTKQFCLVPHSSLTSTTNSQVFVPLFWYYKSIIHVMTILIIYSSFCHYAISLLFSFSVFFLALLYSTPWPFLLFSPPFLVPFCFIVFHPPRRPKPKVPFQLYLVFVPNCLLSWITYLIIIILLY